MKKNIGIITLTSLFLSLSCLAQNKHYSIPTIGNAFEIGKNIENNTVGKNSTLLKANNIHPIRVYFKLLDKGNLNIQLKVKTRAKGSIKATFFQNSKIIDFTSGDQLLNVGKFKTNQAGYHFIELSAVKGEIEISDVIVGGEATQKGIIFSNDPEYFYWARRGPSCHLAYEIPTDQNVSYFYNEIYVPKGQDVIGSYFMANGFGEGYFGIQVNSENERRILFSVWSPFVTDDPSSIPDEEKILLLKKGQDVYTGEFGNEGSGGQSYLKYKWKAETTYKFLLKGIPNHDNSTTYTAWFYKPEQNKWEIIASFKRPKTSTYLKHFHSFLENFIPNQGFHSRQVHFNNQWVYDGEWKKINQAKLTVDATYRANQRVDATGGVTSTGYFLKMGGFFNEINDPGTKFQFKNTQQPPQINFDQLP